MEMKQFLNGQTVYLTMKMASDDTLSLDINKTYLFACLDVKEIHI